MQKISKTTITLLLIILIGAFLRLYDFDNLLRFNADQVRDMQIVEQLHQNQEIPFFGPKAGGTKFNLGGVFYYLEYLSGIFFGFSPAGIAFFIPLLSITSIYLFYLLFKKIFPINITLGLTFLYAISFYGIKYSHFAWNPNAIPFFILAFFLLLNKIVHYSQVETRNCLVSKQKCRPAYLDFIYLGITIGIATQLHTTLLILMPTTTFLVIIYTYLKKEKIKFLNIFLIIFFFILINAPFIYGNILDKGDNLREFIAGANTKAGTDTSIFKNASQTIQFFLQGSTYYLTGIEPQKNWLNPLKLLKIQNLSEIILFATTLLLFIAGAVFTFTQKLKNKNPARRPTLILSGFAILAFIFFTLIGNELNIRFFIIVSFLPYLFLGALATALIESNKLKRITLTIIFLFVLMLTFLNLNIYGKTYNLNNYQAPESAYGGISLGELNNLCLQLKNNSTQFSDNNPVALESFEFKKSLDYVCLKNHNLKITYFNKENIPANQTIFAITENQNTSKNIDFYQKNNFKIDTSQIKRFTFLTISPLQP